MFIAGSCNEDNDADFSEYIPASFDLPNLLTIGAVDSEGKKTSFTTEGKSVDFYANGFEVESYVLGGDRLKFSGTSMASPNVANLAAKLLVGNPKLKRAESIKLIKDGTDKSAEDENILLINPKKSFSMLK
ncbi:MAG: S8 family serine peptidase [Pyrinomonadaceae bacterium]